jgi:hypothetical protein
MSWYVWGEGGMWGDVAPCGVGGREYGDVYCAMLRLGDGGLEVSTYSDLPWGACEAGEARPSSIDGKAIPLASVLRAFANEEVRRRVMETPEEIVPMVSLRLIEGLDPPGEGGRRGNGGEDCREVTRERTPGS